MFDRGKSGNTKCPHCLHSFHDSPKIITLGNDADSQWNVKYQTCPECRKFVIHFLVHDRRATPDGEHYYNERTRLAYPKTTSRAPLAPEVPSPHRDDYIEACLTLADSPKASAALGRRCLQGVLRDKAGVTPGNLVSEIQQAIKAGMPSHFAESLDAIRNIGNFAAHPMKDTATGQLLDVEEGEAEWTLDVLEALFDFYFVQPAILQKKKDALNAKLKAAGKSPMK